MGGVRVYRCAFACVRVYMCVWGGGGGVRVCACACVRVYMCVCVFVCV